MAAVRQVFYPRPTGVSRAGPSDRCEPGGH